MLSLQGITLCREMHNLFLTYNLISQIVEFLVILKILVTSSIKSLSISTQYIYYEVEIVLPNYVKLLNTFFEDTTIDVIIFLWPRECGIFCEKWSITTFYS